MRPIVLSFYLNKQFNSFTNLYVVHYNLSLYFVFSSGEQPDVVEVGKISFSPAEVLGHGTEGTFVFRWVIMNHEASFSLDCLVGCS